MAFELDPALPLARAVRKAALDELRGALRRLKRGTVRDVHEVRKSVKKLRAWARLLRPVLGDDYVVLNRLLRDAGRALAGTRDRTVARATLTSLRLPAAERAQLLEQVLEQLPAGTRRQRANGRHLSERLLRVAQLYVRRAALSTTGRAQLERRLRAAQRQSRAAYVRARRRPTDANFHEWRKRAKYESYQRKFLAPGLPHAAQGTAPLGRLGDVLGRHHDLAVLAQLIRRKPGAATRHALRIIRAQQAQLGQRACRIEARLLDRG